ncbi:bifunctional riboflavin kinase/FAD synthetase [Kocuria sp. M4R2S49]|uniref:bifunctional riboflavin kinase/FAD synthetase n=1 Tax=Kocuria rhizosphaericola TaxID=3376284 RepID=UPI0037AD0895
MFRWRDLSDVPPGFGPSVVTIGNFDGVHRGHQQVLSQLVDSARERDWASVVVTFDPHPAQVHRPGSHPGLIMGTEDKLDALERTGADAALVLEYTLEIADQTTEQFVLGTLVGPLDARCLVVGADTRLGKDNTGNIDTLRELGERHGFEVRVVDDLVDPLHEEHPEHAPAVTGAGERRCSSTWIRACLQAGDVRAAARLLGRHHRVRGEVVHGAARGRELGYPTANLSPDAAGFVPADGVYAGWLVDAAGTRWPTAISVGSNPTFENVPRQVEAHVIDRPEERVEDFDLYGQEVVVEFVARLRGMVAYEGVDKLVAQMDDDVERTRGILAAEA